MENGVQIRPKPGREKVQTAWTAKGTDDSWLVLDRNSNGIVDDATELFSCAAPQPAPLPGQIGNGFLALAEFDIAENGGNGDGLITRADEVFAQLRLWRDVDHNGESNASELYRLQTVGLRKLHLDYQESRKEDRHGNKFKYRAKVKDAQDAQLGRWAYDVFLVARE